MILIEIVYYIHHYTSIYIYILIVHAKFMACHVHKIPCFRELSRAPLQGAARFVAVLCVSTTRDPRLRAVLAAAASRSSGTAGSVCPKFDWKFEVWKSIM
jgi:predicted ferric reductase